MDEKKIIPIEDRIPQLKERRQKKANRRLIVYLTVFFLLLLSIIYLQSPLSHIQNVQVTGNTYIDDDDIVAASLLTSQTNIWSIDKDEVKKMIEMELPAVQSVQVERQLPTTVVIEVQEYNRVGYLKDEGDYYLVLENGILLQNHDVNLGQAPVLIGFDDEQLKEIAAELNKLPVSIANLISEIHWRPNKERPGKVLLYMIDGYIVEGTLRNFGEKMAVYPSIVSQLRPDQKGVINIGVGAYFEQFNNEEENDEE